MPWKYLRLVAGMAAAAACRAPDPGPARRDQIIAPSAAAVRTECDRVAASGSNQGMYQYVAIVAPSRDEILRLDLIHTEGLSLPDHPSTDQLADGRVSVGSFATDAAIAALCDRGCTHARRCDILVITSKEQLLTRWKQLQCDVEPEPGTARDPGCEKP